MQPVLIPPSAGAAALQTHQPHRHPLLRILWVALSLFTLGIFIASIPDYYFYLRSKCGAPSACATGQLSAFQAHELGRLGISLTGYATAFVALAVVSGAFWCAVAAVLFFRGPNNLMTLFAAFTLVIFGLARFPDAPTALATADPAWWLPVAVMRFLGSACLSYFCYLFPDGKFIPKWTALAGFLWLIPQVPEFFQPASPLNPNLYPPWLQALGFLGFVASVVVAQTYRYWYVSSPQERQQTKWVIWGVGVALTGFLALTFVLPVFLPSNIESAVSGPYVEGAAYGVMLLVPLSLGVAIVRHRLYDIDLLINRTLVYGSLSGALALIYFAGIVLLQSVVQAIDHTARESPLVIVASTLLIAALFQPLRQQIQTVIDRRFYRRKYDAAKVLEDFAAGLQNEVDLAAVTYQLTQVVEETMHPVQVSLWLRQPMQPEQPPPPAE
ncbi:MAG: hypothetical protein ACLQUY_18615 [Ktedonobacterales bacterium]